MKSLLVRWGSAVRLFDFDESAASRARFRRSAFICRSDFRRNKKVWRETKAENLIPSYVSINTNRFCLHISHSAHKLISNFRYRACSNHCRLVVTVQSLLGSRPLLCIVNWLNLAIERLVQLWNGAWKLGDCCDSLVRSDNYIIIVTSAEPED